MYLVERTYLEGEEYREPAQHIGRDLRHSIWVGTDSDVVVQNSLKISSKPMHEPRVRDVER